MATAKANAEPGIDLETLFKAVEFKPHSDGQWEYCRSDVRFNVPCCGRRWGKSIATGHRATHKAFIPDAYVWVVGPTYKLGEKEFRIIYRDFEKLGLLKHCRKSYSVNQGNMRIQTPWNSVVEVVSAEKPDSLLGEGLTHAVMSEAARHSRATWEQYIEPALSDLRGSADFPSTPTGYNWYHGLYLLGQDPATQNNYRSWNFPSWTNPVRFPGGYNDPELVRIRSQVSKQYFDQEYAALFTSFAGAIYEEFDPRIHVQPHTYNPNWPNFQAFDFGFANPFVCLDIQVSPSDDVYVWREYYQSYKSTYEHGLALAARQNDDGVRVDGRWGDPRGADEIATLALSLGFVAAVDVPWKHGTEEIKRLLKANKLHISPNCPNLVRQLEQLHVKEAGKRTQDLQEQQGDGNIQHKVDDHAADALRYFIGPYFVQGANSHLEDIYGKNYKGSESEDFFKLNKGFVLDSSVRL